MNRLAGMPTTQPMTDAPLFLGVEGGGTRTVAILADADGRRVRRVEGGPANLKLLTQEQLANHLAILTRELPRPAAVCVGLAGLRSDKDSARVLSAAAGIWPAVPCSVCSDLEVGLAAAGTSSVRSRPAQVLVL